jgi:hypothetical protein
MNAVTYTNLRDGRTVTSSLTEQQAREALRGQRSDFAQSLARATRWSAGQLYWVHKIATEALAPRQPAANVGDAAGIVALFATASSRLKHPKISVVDSATNLTIKLSPAKADSRNAGFIYVKANDQYAGKLGSDGRWFPVGTCPAGVAEFLVEFAKAPARHAAVHGHRTGNCCFCSRLLTDAVSVAVGYGPVCAENYGLPHAAPAAQEASAVEAAPAVPQAGGLCEEYDAERGVWFLSEVAAESAAEARAAELDADQSILSQERW